METSPARTILGLRDLLGPVWCNCSDGLPHALTTSSITPQVNDAFSVIYNHTFSPTFLNEARANAAGWRWNEITSNPQAPVGLPQDNITFFAPNAGVSNFGSALGSILNQWTYGYKDVATKVLRQHTIKFGADFTNLHYLGL